MKTACVVGSGPSGAACAFGLLKSGVEVTMLDVGIEIEHSLKDLTHNTAPVDADAFLQRVRQQRNLTAKVKAIPAKMPFGSDYAYRPIAASRVELDRRTVLVSSMALGGLSNGWGANVCSLAAHDMDDWPFRKEDLDPYFKPLEELVDIAGSANDALNDLYGAPLKQSESFPLGPQGRHVLERVYEHAETLKQRGLYCGRAKLAVGSRYASNGEGCVSCGLCMHGCPYNAIWNSRDVVTLLRQQPGFRYLPGRFVQRFKEGAGRTTVFAEVLASGDAEELHFDRVYLACGVIGTTAVVARSLDLCDHTFEIKDSTKYLFPFLTDRRLHGSMHEPANTLSQVFLQSVRLESTPRTVHGQLYGYNDLILDPLRKIVGDAVYTLGRAAAFLFERIMIGMVYLHSDDSGTLLLDVSPEGGHAGLGRIQGVETRRSEVVLGDYMRTLTAARRELGGRPLRRLASKNPPGLSQHFGGSLPMKREPDRWSTDPYGRPWGCERTHCVDSSVLPSIPGTPPTLILMANALRIAETSRSL